VFWHGVGKEVVIAQRLLKFTTMTKSSFPLTKVLGVFFLLTAGFFSEAQAQSQTTYRGDIAVYLKDGSVEYTDRVSLGYNHVRLGKFNESFKIDADWVEYVDIITNQGKELHLIQAEVESNLWGLFPMVNKAWLKQYWASERIELFKLEEIRFDAPAYTPYGNWAGNGYSQSVKYFYRKDGGQVKTLDINLVLEDVQDNPEAYALAERAKKMRTTGQVLTGVGLAGILGGTYVYPELAERNSDVQLGMALSGLGVFTVGAIMSIPMRARMLKALRAYE